MFLCLHKHNVKSVYDLHSAFRDFKEAKSATMNIFRFFYFLFKSFVKVELSYVFTIYLFTIAENCTEKVNCLLKTGLLVIICVPPIIIDN